MPGRGDFVVQPLERLAAGAGIIRQARVEDDAQLASIQEQARCLLRAVYRPTPAGNRNHGRLAAVSHCMVVEVEGTVVATFQYYGDGNRLRLMGLAVHEAYRCSGIARACVAYCSRLAQAQGYEALCLATIKETGNVPLFEHLGFRSVDAQQSLLCQGPDGEPVVEVELELRPEVSGGG